MKKFVPGIILIGLLIATYFMYNKQLGAIPILLLSFYLFYIVYTRIKVNKTTK